MELPKALNRYLLKSGADTPVTPLAYLWGVMKPAIVLLAFKRG